MNIIIAGEGKVGTALVRDLSAENYALTTIDTNTKVLEDIADKYDVFTVQGNCASMETLRKAGVERADLIIAVTNADEVNLLCCLAAHQLNPNLHTIARIRNPEYTEQIYAMRDYFGLSMSINPERSAASEIERLLSLPGFLDRESFAKGRVEIVEIRVDEKNILDGVPLYKLNTIIKSRVLVCAVVREGNVIMPSGDFVLRPEDRIFVTAATSELVSLLRSIGKIKKKVASVLIAGGGRISFYIAEALSKRGIYVKIIERDYDRALELANKLPSVDIIEGDASAQDLLERECISEFDAVVALTGIDEMNAMIGMYANSIDIPQVVTKISRMSENKLIDNLPIGSIVCPKEICSNAIVRYVRAMKNQVGAAVSVHTIAAGQAEAIEFVVDESTLHRGQMLRDIRTKDDVLIASISHYGKVNIPSGDSTFDIGDTVVVVTKKETVINQINDIFA